MKKKFIFTLSLFTLLGSILTIAQELPSSLKWETRKTIDEVAQRRHYNQSHSADEVITLNSILPDFQVNENAGPGSADKYFPSISTDGNGNFVITWGDERNGYYNDIYAQRYSSDGTALGGNFKVNDDEGSEEWASPSISTDGNGDFVITWNNFRNGYNDIYAQRYSSDGTALGGNFKVNDDEGSARQRSPSISTDGNGNFVITWEDYRNGDFDIYAQRYSSDGTALAGNFKVNDDEGSEDQRSPSISTDGNGNFVITWEDYRNNNDYSDIYAQRYSSVGTALEGNFKVNDDEGSA